MAVTLKEYNVLEKIGSGSYSVVYKAKRKAKSDDVVAIKVVEVAKLSPTGKDNIVTEIRLLKMLKHKYIVEMRDFMYDEKNIYIVMEYCNGGDLSAFIKSRQKLPEKRCQKFLQQLAVGLQFLRSRNISHLDLKPQNLLLVTKPQIMLKIADFGFARFLSDKSQEHSMRGSPLYMAPEILSGLKYDARADLWSVGVITYECLFGKAPYSSNTYAELHKKVVAKFPITIPTNVPLSEECRDFLIKLLKHDPNLRMTYDEFFSHPFLDLEHFPSENSYQKAMRVIEVATRLNNNKQYAEAFTKYSEALRYLLPILHDETDPERKVKLHSEIMKYTTKAEELKTSFINLSRKKNVNNSGNTESPLKSSQEKYDLTTLCSSTPDLKAGMEIGMTAQMYLAEGEYKHALESFTSALGILMRKLETEPPGLRRDLLYKQVQTWLTQAESTKSLLSFTEEKSDEYTDAVEKETCVIQ